MEYISNKLTDFIVKKGVIREEDYAIYHYGLLTGMEVMLCVLLSIIISILLDVLLQSFVVAIVLFSLRSYICGIHMKKYISCLIWSTSILTAGVYAATYIPLSKDILFIICLIILPTIHKLSYYTVAYNSQSDEIPFFTKQRKRIIAGIFVFVIVLAFCNNLELLKQVCYALVVALASIVLERIRIRSRKKKNNISEISISNDIDYILNEGE
ncbi:MAG: accessory gene regulator B family protein [Lachnospiraceae bacterium]|nr:accessory gene regulator B family protein [Lachnospiraceae bacterium]